MKIDDIVDEIIKSGKRKTDPMIIKATLLYFGAILLNRYSIRKNIQTLPNRINLYCLVFAVSGQGKALANSEDVLTPNGFIKNGTLKVGDYVIGSNGLPTKILQVHKQGTRKIYRVSFRDGTHLMCDKNHLFTVRKRWNNKLETISVNDMLGNGLHIMRLDKRYNKEHKEYQYSVQYNKECNYGNDDNLSIDPYLLGLLLGDGCFRLKSGVDFTNHNEALVDEVITRLPKGSILGRKVFSKGAYHITIVGESYVKSSLRLELEKLGLIGHKSTSKFIPKIYKNGTLKTRKEIIRGLIDTDGYIKDGKLNEFSTSSKQLADDFLELGRSIGMQLNCRSRIPKYKHKGETKYGAKNYRIMELNASKFKTIQNIEYSHEEEATCISIDSDDMLYIAGKGFTVTHNSYIMKIVENLCDLETYAQQRRTVYEYIMDLSECEPDEQISKFLNGNSYSLGVAGTKEGLFEYAKAYSASKFGSVNIQSDEIGDNINGSSDLLNQLKQMYDGSLQKKIIKGGEDDTPDDDIHNIICNFYGTGSKSAIDNRDRKKLTNLIKSGMFRRSICIDSKLQVKKKIMEEVNYEPIHKWFIDLNLKHKESLSSRLEKYGMVGTLDVFMAFNNDAVNKIDEIDTLLVQRADKDKISDLKQIDTGSLDMIVNVACIISFIEDSEMVSVEHLDEAYQFFLETRETVEKTFDDVHAHDEAYRVLKLKGSLTHSEIMDISGLGIIPRGKNQWKDTVELVHELCYRNGEYLKESTGRVSRYTIEPLPETELSKLIFSLSVDNRGAKSIEFKAVELEWDDIEYLAKSSKVESFTTSHYESSSKTGDHGHRKAENAIQGQNVICFDIDNGLTIENARQLFSSFTYCIYTTKSHQSEKGNYCDRFRIILPTKHKFFVTPEQHKEMIINAENVLGLKNNDMQTRNVSRLWFTNPEADIITNDGELFDVSGIIPDTNKSDKFLPKLREMLKATNNETAEEIDEIENRINGMMKYSASIVAVGNLDGTLFNLGAMCIDLQYTEWERKMYEFTSMIGSPIRFTDRVISSLKTKYKL